MKKVLIYISLIFLLPTPLLLKAFAQDETGGEQLQGGDYRGTVDYPHVTSPQETDMNAVIQQQQKVMQQAIETQNEMMKKLQEVEQGGGATPPPGTLPPIPPEGEVVEAVKPEVVLPPSAAISESDFKCRHVTITMPENSNCGYLITTSVDGKSAKILMLESSEIRRGQCLLDIDCERPTNP